MMKLVQGEDYLIRIIDLPRSTPALVSVDETGFANIYISARLTPEQQRDKAAHEIEHLTRGDVYSADDIRAVEGGDVRAVDDITGARLACSPAAYRPEDLRRIDEGLYLPRGAASVAKARSTLDGVRHMCERMLDGLGWWNRPALPALGLDDVRYIAFDPDGLAMLRYERGDDSGTVYYGRDGAVDSAVLVLPACGRVLSVVIMRNGRLFPSVYSVHDMTGGAWKELWRNEPGPCLQHGWVV